MRDFRYAWRSLQRSKGFVAVAVLSLGLALGLNTTVYAVLDAFIHPWVPFPDPERVLVISSEGDPRQERISWAERDAMLLTSLRSLSDSIAFAGFSSPYVVSAGSYRGDVQVRDVSANYFQVTGIVPELGRLFEPRGGENLAVVEHGFWLRALGGRRDLEGATIQIQGQIYSVVAVVPAGQPYLFRRSAPEIWRLRPNDLFASYRWGSMGGLINGRPVARLRPGVTLEDATGTLNRLAQSLESRFGIVRMWPFRFRIETLRPDPYHLSQFHLALAASAGMILLIACANLANLMSARGVARRRELALRIAIGASRGQLVRQLLHEAGLLAALGGVLGLLAAIAGVGLVRAALPQLDFLALEAPHITWRVLAFGVAGAAATVLVFGLIPALRASDIQVTEPLKEGAGTHTGRVHRFSSLAVAQVSVALLLVMGGAVMFKVVRNLAGTPFGFESKGLHQVWMALDPGRYPDGPAVSRAFADVMGAVERIPGIRGATTANVYQSPVNRIVTSDYAGDSLSMMMLPNYVVADHAFLRVLGIAIKTGRDFAPGDRETGAAIVNESAARQLWPRENPVGRLIKLGHSRAKAPWFRVVGVAEQALCCDNIDPDLPDPPQVYVVPRGGAMRNQALLFRVASGSAAAIAEVTLTIREMTGSTIDFGINPWFVNFQSRLAALRFTTRIFALVGLCGLALAAVGLYGVLSYATSRRMREFGVRKALGATSEDVFRTVLGDGAVMFVGGAAIGGLIGMTTGVILQGIYESPPPDWASLIIAVVVLGTVAFGACFIPARRAMRADPVEILRAT